MITCCEIALTSIVANVICLAIFRNYYIKMKWLTLELKKKNGYEQHQLDQIKEWMGDIQRSLSDKDKEIAELKSKLKS